MDRRLHAREFLAYIAIAKTHQLRDLLHNTTDQELKALCEVALNIVHGNLRTTTDITKRKDFLKTLASKTLSLNKKRIILTKSPTYRNTLQKIIKNIQ